jgi:hypothetical protein
MMAKTLIVFIMPKQNSLFQRKKNVREANAYGLGLLMLVTGHGMYWFSEKHLFFHPTKLCRFTFI